MPLDIGTERQHQIPSSRTGVIRRAERHPFILAFVLAGLSLAMVRLSCWKIPAVSNMDEFSVLLQADTFRHLRLTNQTHALWESFETLHVIQVPTYASKFPPAPSAVVALGQTIYGNPIWGSWLANVAAALAVYWMFAAWLPRRWAFAGGLLTILNPVVLFWGGSYLACATGLAGAALSIGAGRRIIRRGGWLNGVILAVGFGILANTRPFEGLLFAILTITWILLRTRGSLLRSAAKGALPAGLAILAFMAYYNWRVTRNPLELPHIAHHKQYDMAPSFIFQRPPAVPQYRDAHIWQFHRWELFGWEVQQQGMPWVILRIKLQRLAYLIEWPAGVFLLLIPVTWRDRKVRYAAVGIVFIATAMMTTIWLNLNYVAPIAALFIIVEMAGLRYLICYGPLRRIPIVTALTVIIAALAIVLAVPLAHAINLNDSNYGEARRQIESSLSQSPQGSLIFVQYSQDHNRFEEWVYNSADIDSQRVIWALDKGPEQNKQMERYFAGRSYWLFRADDRVLDPYPLLSYAEGE